MTRKRWLILGGTLLLVAVVALSLVQSGKKVDEVEVLPAEKGEVAPTVTADGLIAAKVMVNISSQVMGEIISLPILEGASAKKGDVLVQINPDTFQRDVSSAQANLASSEVASRQAQALLAQRERDWKRAQELSAQGILPPSQMEDSRLALEQAQLSVQSSRSQVAQARAYLQKAQDNLAKTTMRSPIDGVVTAVNAKVGETAVMGTMNFAGTVILTVSDMSEIIAEIQVDEADYPRLRRDQPVVVTVDALGEKKHEGKVIEIGASARPGSQGLQSNIRQFLVKVAISNPGDDLRPGMTARVRLLADKREGVLRIPIGAIRTEEKSGEQVLFVFVAEKGKAVKKTVTTGISDDLFTEIASGLAEKDQVILGPYRLLRLMKEGDRVKPKVLKTDEFVKSRKAGPSAEVHVE